MAEANYSDINLLYHSNYSSTINIIFVSALVAINRENECNSHPVEHT